MATPDPYEPPDEQNLFAAPHTEEHARSTTPSSQPGPLAIVISVLVAILVSIPVFMITFFFTCLGLSSMQVLDNEAGFAVIVLIASATAILSIVLVTKGLLALVRAFKST